MKIPPFRLQAPLRIRRHQRDLCRGFLAEALAELSRCQAEVEACESERDATLNDLREIAKNHKLDVDRAVSRRIHAGQLTIRILNAQRKVSLAESQVEMCRWSLVQADQKVKALEKIEENDRIEFVQKQERRDAREREDNWISTHAYER